MTKRVTLRTLPERAVIHSQVDTDTVILVNIIGQCIKTGILNWLRLETDLFLWQGFSGDGLMRDGGKNMQNLMVELVFFITT